ncbi:MAG: DUF1080 domain-containing protein [Verrucomicrobiota bacterium]|jgi:hypothetical protein
MKTRAPLLLLACCSLLSAAEPAAPKAKPAEPTAFLTVEAAGSDFLLQGEFATKGLGADIIALGADKYRLVIFQGGLPGAGWDGSAKAELEGIKNGSKVDFTPKAGEARATLEDGQLKLNRTGNEATTLSRIIRRSPTEGLAAPAGAKILFDGKNADAWKDGKVDERGFLRCGTTSKDLFKDYTLHLEFMLPFKPFARGQGRANSGVYHQDRYEVQVLDSFGLKGENNECGGIYTISSPKVNMCLPPLQWQTYDINFTAAKFDAQGQRTAWARITVRHNGVLIQDNVELPHTTTSSGIKTITDTLGPFQLQEHGNPVYYRNIWVLEK